jgi:hypothetical protein
MSMEVRLLSPPANFAVVQLPGRKFPGVVVQGDTLHGLVNEVDGLVRLLRSNEVDDEILATLELISEKLTGAMNHYEHVCAEHGISLPYPR